MTRAVILVGALIALGACSHIPSLTPDPVVVSPAGAPAAAAADGVVDPRERIRLAAELLASGDETKARTELEAALIQRPDDKTASRLLEQIKVDPRVLLGSDSTYYVVQAGDTMSGLAERFVGDPLMFYALARYNGIAAPSQLSVGRTLVVPRSKLVGGAGSSAAAAPVVAMPPVLNAATSPSAAQAERARALRLQGLEHLNTGKIDQAVSLLRQAVSLDGADSALQRDLDRALRIQTSLGKP